MKKTRLLPIALLLSTMTLAGCDINDLMFWKKGEQQQEEQKKEEEKKEEGTHVPTQEELDDGRELIPGELYTDSGFRIEFDAVGAKIKKMYYESLLIAKDGFVAGRCANRIANGEFELNGQTYNVDINENGKHHLHGGSQGFGTKTWTLVEQHPSSITYSYHSIDGEMGYPGNLDITVKYTLLNNGELSLEYSAKSDADTIINPTNHIWLSLNGANAQNHTLWINADNYTPRDSELIPTGEILPVAGTKYDFREEGTEFVPANKYDDNWVLNGTGFRKVATLTGVESGIKCDISTDRPGLQMYNDNTNIVLETQLYPDAIHHSNWPSPILRANTDFYTKSIYAFSVVE